MCEREGERESKWEGVRSRVRNAESFIGGWKEKGGRGSVYWLKERLTICCYSLLPCPINIACTIKIKNVDTLGKGTGD